MLDPANVAALSRKGRVFCLVATPQEIVSRLKEDKNNPRPLLNTSSPEKQIIELLQEREKGYQPFLKLATDGKQPAEVAVDLLVFMEKNQDS